MVDEVTLPMPLPILLQVTLTLLVPCLAHPQQNLNNQLPFFVVHRINESTSRRECLSRETASESLRKKWKPLWKNQERLIANDKNYFLLRMSRLTSTDDMKAVSDKLPSSKTYLYSFIQASLRLDERERERDTVHRTIQLFLQSP